jgi:4-hydroxybenzoate polyprenyltransferase
MEPLSEAELTERLADDAALTRPLGVALEGALVRTDPLWERLLVVLKRQPWLILLLPVWLLGGRGSVERAVTARNAFDASILPYRKDLLEAMRQAKAKGRRLLLVASDGATARAVGEHLDLFAEVIVEPLARGVRSEAELLARAGAGGFDFVGHDGADFPLLAKAERGYVAGASSAVASRAAGLGGKVQVLSTRRSLLRALIKVLRPHQWSKNALVVVPLLLSPGAHSPQHIISALLAFTTFSLCASAGYVFNDLIDIDADRAHRTKFKRPFASGDLPVLLGPPLFLALFVSSFVIAIAALPAAFVGMLAVYFVATMSYSLVLKSKLMVDVVVLAGLYTHRVLSGGIATGIVISAWLLAFSLFMFSSLAFCKRYVELRQATKGGQLKSRGYRTEDQEMVASMGPTAGYMAVLLFCLFIHDANSTAAAYKNPALLWFVVPVLLYWISRVWFLAHRGQMQDDPVKFALTDKRSWACAILTGLVAAAARFW